MSTPAHQTDLNRLHTGSSDDDLASEAKLYEMLLVPCTTVIASLEPQQFVGIGVIALAVVAVISQLIRIPRGNGTAAATRPAAPQTGPSSTSRSVKSVRPTYLAVAIGISIAAIYGSVTPFTPIALTFSDALEQFRQLDFVSWGYHGRIDWISNFLLAFGLGLAWQAYATPEGKRDPRWGIRAVVIVLGTMAALTLLEFVQLWLPTRITSPHDLQAQLLGVSCGVYFWRILGNRATTLLSAFLAGHRPTQPIDLFARFYFAAFLFFSLRPFDITIHPVELYRKFVAGRVILVPFSGSEYLFEEMFRHGLSYLPIGVLATITLTPATKPLRRIEPAILISFLIACAVEVTQVFIGSRVADASQVISGTLGAAVGVLLMHGLGATVQYLAPVPARSRQEWLTQWTVTGVAGIACVFVTFWQPQRLSAGEEAELRRSIGQQIDDAFSAVTSIDESDASPEPIGLTGPVGCLSNPTRRHRLIITEPGIYSNYLVDGNFTRSNVVKINTGPVVLKNCEVRHGTNCGVLVLAEDVIIDSCRIYNHIAGTFRHQEDAHGISGTPRNLIIRNCEIFQVSGDGIQFDPSREKWDRVLIENCRIWNGPLDAQLAGYEQGERPGENAIDTKQFAANPRSRMVVRNCVFVGWNEGNINNQAALNLKENIETYIHNCVFLDNEICFRLRGPASRERGGAHVTISDCACYDSTIIARMEDRIEHLTIRRMGIGSGIDRSFYIDRGKIGPGYVNEDEFPAPPIETVLQYGVRSARHRSASDRERE